MRSKEDAQETRTENTKRPENPKEEGQHDHPEEDRDSGQDSEEELTQVIADQQSSYPIEIIFNQHDALPKTNNQEDAHAIRTEYQQPEEILKEGRKCRRERTSLQETEITTSREIQTPTLTSSTKTNTTAEDHIAPIHPTPKRTIQKGEEAETPNEKKQCVLPTLKPTVATQPPLPQLQQRPPTTTPPPPPPPRPPPPPDPPATATAPLSAIKHPTHQTHLTLKRKTKEWGDAETPSEKKPCSLSSSTTTSSSTNDTKKQITYNTDNSPSTIPTDITTTQTGDTRSRPESNNTAKKPRTEIDSTKQPSDCGFESHQPEEEKHLPENWLRMSREQRKHWRYRHWK